MINGFESLSFFESSFDFSVTLTLLSKGFVLAVDEGTGDKFVLAVVAVVVVAVLNVTTVLVDRLTAVETLSSSSFSALTVFIEESTLSTSSLDSSPRRKLNIMASLVFDESFFLFRLKSVEADDFGLTNEIEFGSSSSASSLHSRETVMVSL